jgi:hypothetical protein
LDELNTEPAEIEINLTTVDFCFPISMLYEDVEFPDNP